MNNSICINGRYIGDDYPTYVIAEMSANHLQNIDRAKCIILEAKYAGADAIKLQSYRPDTITIDCRGEEFMASKGSLWEGKNLYQLYEEAYMPWEWHKDLFEYAQEIGITIFSSPFDFSSVDLLEELNAPAYKIASYEIMDIPLIRKVAQTGKPIILSTGIANISDIQLAIDTCKKEGNSNIVLLKCVSEYPTPYEDINLNTLRNMSETFDVITGLSDHSMGSVVDVAAVALGAKIIEKHLTLSREDGGPDCVFSIEPKEFKQMVEDIRNTEKALGNCTYELNQKQINSRSKSRSLYVVSDIKKGEIITDKNVKSIRPGYGIKPMYYDEVLGMVANKELKRGTALSWADIERE